MKKLMFLTILLAACGDSVVRVEAKRNMVMGCISELGAMESGMELERVKAFCECAVDNIAKNYTDAELKEMAVNPDKFEDRSAEDAVRAITKCQDKLIPDNF